MKWRPTKEMNKFLDSQQILGNLATQPLVNLRGKRKEWNKSQELNECIIYKMDKNEKENIARVFH